MPPKRSTCTFDSHHLSDDSQAPTVQKPPVLLPIICTAGNPAFKRMGGIKTLFVWELLNLGLQPILTDADAVWCAPLRLKFRRTKTQHAPPPSSVIQSCEGAATSPPRRLRDPRQYFQRGSLAIADVLVSSDCIEVPNDEQWEGGGECDTTVNFNTGTLFFRNTPSALEFVGRWHEKVTQSEEKWMRDQPAFNLLARGDDGLQMRVRCSPHMIQNPPLPADAVRCREQQRRHP